MDGRFDRPENERKDAEFSWTLAAEEPPERLYHYTSFAGLLGIVEQEALWASSIHHLNDSLEITLSFDRFRETIGRRTKGARTNKEQCFLEGIGQVVSSLLWATSRVGEHANLVYSYVTSFCHESDRLSQWRAYCPPNGGVCIGFNSMKLRNLAEGQGFDLVRCRYREDEQEDLIASFIASLFAHLEPTLGSIKFTAERIEEPDTWYNAIWRDHVRDLVRCAAAIKGREFHEELEWRLISQGPPSFRHGAKYREARKTIVPYVVLHLCPGDGDLLPIDQVVIGPGSRQRLTQVSVENLLVDHGLQPPHCELIVSKSGYRP